MAGLDRAAGRALEARKGRLSAEAGSAELRKLELTRATAPRWLVVFRKVTSGRLRRPRGGNGVGGVVCELGVGRLFFLEP